jgi:hypothetical protein
MRVVGSVVIQGAVSQANSTVNDLRRMFGRTTTAPIAAIAAFSVHVWL